MKETFVFPLGGLDVFVVNQLTTKWVRFWALRVVSSTFCPSDDPATIWITGAFYYVAARAGVGPVTLIF